MKKDSAIAGGGHATVALVLGKTGVHASVDGQKPVRLPRQPAMPLTAASLLKALMPFTAKNLPTDLIVDVLVIGTKADGTPGWDGIAVNELNNGSPETVKFTELSEAQALQRGYSHGGDISNFLVYSAKTNEFGRGRNAIQHDDERSGINGHLIFATVLVDGKPNGSVRHWQQDGNTVAITDVMWMDTKFGQIFTLPGKSFISEPLTVASFVRSFLEAHPKITRVFIWSQDGMNGILDFVPEGSFWVTLTLPDQFREADGKVTIVPTALSVATLGSTHLPASPATNPTANVQPNNKTAENEMEN